jgi:hypothetical protein
MRSVRNFSEVSEKLPAYVFRVEEKSSKQFSGCFLLVAILAYTSILKMETTPSETSVNSTGLLDVTSQ